LREEDGRAVVDLICCPALWIAMLLGQMMCLYSKNNDGAISINIVPLPLRKRIA